MSPSRLLSSASHRSVSFIIVAGAATESCSYQTPGSLIVRYLWERGLSTLGNVFQESRFISLAIGIGRHCPWSPGGSLTGFFRHLVLTVPSGLLSDVSRLGRSAIRVLLAPATGAYNLVRRAHTWLRGVQPPLQRGLDLRMTAPNLQCISWTLQTSLDKSAHLTALEYLITITEPTGLDSTLITSCFDIFVGCIDPSDEKMVVMEGS